VTEATEDYSYEETGRLELIWGKGFLSPGGPAEVTRILGGQSLVDCAVLDIGSGAGGVDIVLVEQHGAATVVGVDVQQDLVDLASERARLADLDDRIRYRLVEPGPLPFECSSFDAVFSKDSIIHVRDKEALYAEAFRVLRPGGRLLVGDWLRADGDELTAQIESFVEAAGHDFSMATLAEIEAILERVGFSGIDIEDRRAWYLEEARAELERIRGSMWSQFVDNWGVEAAYAETEFWEVLVSCLATGALSPGQLRAQKPHDELVTS
jgi:phosphoethanolamine N-methyltransferase